MQAISTKELRLHLPSIRRKLNLGEEFLLIHQSQPIAKLTPVPKQAEWQEATDNEVEAATIADLDDDYLSATDLKHYLSIK